MMNVLNRREFVGTALNVDRIFAIAKDAGYRGFFSMEWEGTGDRMTGRES